MIDATAQGRKTVQRNRRWLLHVENLTMVHLCRREIEHEFGERLHLTADDLLPRIRDYAARSRNGDLRRLARPIERLLNTPADDEPDAGLANIPIVRPRTGRSLRGPLI